MNLLQIENSPYRAFFVPVLRWSDTCRINVLPTYYDRPTCV